MSEFLWTTDVERWRISAQWESRMTPTASLFKRTLEHRLWVLKDTVDVNYNQWGIVSVGCWGKPDFLAMA